MKTKLHFENVIACLTLSLLFTINSLSAQVNWVKYPDNPVMASPSAWFDICWNPEVIYDEDEELFRMWFSGEVSGIYAIGYAESSDGINWSINEEPVIPSGTAGSWDEHRSPGMIIKVGDTLKMWYSGSSDKYVYHISIGYAWSLDNVVWHLSDQPVLEKGTSGSWEDRAVFMPCVYYDGSNYHMWYHGFTSQGIYDPGSIGYATSDDGINWVKDTTNNPVLPYTPGTFYSAWVIPNFILFNDNEYQMWFSGKAGLEDYLRIGYAISPDGINWTVQNDSLPVVDIGNAGEWDDRWVCYSSVLIHEGYYKMWYSGKKASPYIDQIGFAMGDDTTAIESPFIKPAVNNVSAYPNPLSNSTTIEYLLVQPETVTISFYNQLGGMVDLIEKRDAAGRQKVIWTPSKLPGGIYYFKLEVGEQVTGGKLVLINNY